MGLWKRKEFKDFKYLGVQLSAGRKAIVATMTMLFCIVIIVITCAKEDIVRLFPYPKSGRNCYFGAQK